MCVVSYLCVCVCVCVCVLFSSSFMCHSSLCVLHSSFIIVLDKKSIIVFCHVVYCVVFPLSSSQQQHVTSWVLSFPSRSHSHSSHGPPSITLLSFIRAFHLQHGVHCVTHHCQQHTIINNNTIATNEFICMSRISKTTYQRQQVHPWIHLVQHTYTPANLCPCVCIPHQHLSLLLFS